MLLVCPLPCVRKHQQDDGVTQLVGWERCVVVERDCVMKCVQRASERASERARARVHACVRACVRLSTPLGLICRRVAFVDHHPLVNLTAVLRGLARRKCSTMAEDECVFARPRVMLCLLPADSVCVDRVCVILKRSLPRQWPSMCSFGQLELNQSDEN